MASKSVCETYWWKDPAVLLRPQKAPRIGCTTDNVNALAKTLIIVLIIGAIGYIGGGGLIAAIIASITAIVLSLPIIVALFTHVDEVVYEEEVRKPQQRREEGFEGQHTLESAWTLPTPNNPFMNVLVGEYSSNHERAPAVSVNNANVKQSLDDLFKTQWFSDPTDVFGRSQSQRQFVTMPNTSIPNDRESYQNWLYKIPGQTCKEGGRQACLPATDGGPVTWLNMDS